MAILSIQTKFGLKQLARESYYPQDLFFGNIIGILNFTATNKARL